MAHNATPTEAVRTNRARTVRAKTLVFLTGSEHRHRQGNSTTSCYLSSVSRSPGSAALDVPRHRHMRALFAIIGRGPASQKWDVVRCLSVIAFGRSTPNHLVAAVLCHVSFGATPAPATLLRLRLLNRYSHVALAGRGSDGHLHGHAVSGRNAFRNLHIDLKQSGKPRRCAAVSHRSIQATDGYRTGQLGFRQNSGGQPPVYFRRRARTIPSGEHLQNITHLLAIRGAIDAIVLIQHGGLA